MNRKQNRSRLWARNASDAEPTPEIAQLAPDTTLDTAAGQSGLSAGKDGDQRNIHRDPEDFGILLAACRIVASGYKTEISRGLSDSLLVQAAYQLLRHFLERQFAGNSRAA